MLADRVMCAVPNPGPVDVGSTITLGAAPTGYRSYLAAFGGAKPAYFVLSDGASRTITGVWTVNAAVPETATITRIIGNDRTGDTSGEIFAGDCVAWNEVPAAETALLDMFVGVTFEHNGDVLPAGFLWEDGANHSRATYAKLFGRIGIKYGAGDGSTTFAVPDSRGLVAVGRDNMGGTAAGRITAAVAGLDGTVLGARGGDQRMQAHPHGVNDPTHPHGVYDPQHRHGMPSPAIMSGAADGGTPFWQYDGASLTSYAATGISIYAAATGITIQSAGAGNSQNVQPSIVKNKIIFTGVFP